MVFLGNSRLPSRSPSFAVSRIPSQGVGAAADRYRALSDRGQIMTSERAVSGGRTRMDFRIRYRVRRNSPRLSFAFCNRRLLTDANSYAEGAALTIRSMAVEIGASAYALTFNGMSARNVQTGELHFTADLLEQAVTAASDVWLRGSLDLGSTFIAGKLFNITSLGDTPAEQCWVYDPANSGNTILATGAMSAPTGAVASVPFAPVLLFGEPTDLTLRTVMGIGTSIEDRNGDYDTSGIDFGGLSGGGHFRRAARLANVPYTSFAIASGTAQGAVGAQAMIDAFMVYHTEAWCGHGTNDIALGASAATTLTRLRTVWGFIRSKGKAIRQTMVMPRVTSTNRSTSLAGQTPVSGFGSGEAVDTLHAALPGEVGGNLTTLINNLTGVTGDASDVHKWKPRAFSATLTSAASDGASTMFMSAKPGLMEFIVVDPDTGSQSAGGFNHVQATAGSSSPFTVAMFGGDTPAHLISAAVKASPSTDGIHPEPAVCADSAAAIFAALP